MLKQKKAAMFGLDARIALAIFGALSVITGAALFTAIENSKVISAIATLEEVSKAYEAYLLDTGKEPYRPEGSSIFDITKLREDTVKGWDGPYLSFKDDPTPEPANTGFTFPQYPDNLGIYLRLLNDKPWGTVAPFSDSNCDGTSTCYIWIQAYVPPSLALSIDKKIDGSDSTDSGNVRVYKHNDTDHGVFIKKMPARAQTP